MVNQDTRQAEKQAEYYVTIDQTGHDDGFAVCQGTRQVAYVGYSGDEIEEAEFDAQLIADALNAYKSPDDKPLTHEELRKRHYERLNDYRNSIEYQASSCCWQEPIGELKTLIGSRWEINEEIYMDFLEMLPPLGWRGGVFYMREFCFDDITTKFTKEGDCFYSEFARFPGRVAA